MRFMVYQDLNISKVKKQFAKVREAIERDDLKTPNVKKLSQGQYYRAKLDDSNRLLLTFVKYYNETVCLALEVIHQHAYNKSRFLRGATIDEAKLPTLDDKQLTKELQEAPTVRYLHPRRNEFHLLDKVISFDDIQDEVYRSPPPIILVGSAGSGKTALTLQKLRELSGQVLYVTLSAYLAQNARELYAAHGFENDSQEVQFLSFKELLATIQLPQGREVSFAAFRGWLSQQQGGKSRDAHQLFEEFHGVLSSQPQGALTREQYLALGVRQSIFAKDLRPQVYQLFGKYLAWLQSSRLYDSSLVASQYLPQVAVSYDFVVVDEVQDLTAAQLALILGTLKTPEQFLLCGDSNQIVHPNFFAWSTVKSLLYADPQLAERQAIRVLRANFRNASQVTQVANDLLKIKHARFGSVDRESNFLVKAVANDKGSVSFLPNEKSIKRHLNKQTSQSTDYAVLVLRDEDKLAAKKDFDTPLIFSIHEAKGLEYPSIILYDFISSQHKIYSDITKNVSRTDLAVEELEYRRPKDKSDKSLEIYKFYINALYVAVTRAVERVILIEGDTRHPLLSLLGVELGDQDEQIKAQKASRSDWEREARKLELQGKKEQASDIRQRILQQKPVPWRPWTPESLRQIEENSRQQSSNSKIWRELLDFAILSRHQKILTELRDMKIKPAASFLRNSEKDRQIQRQAVVEKYRRGYAGIDTKTVLSQCDKYGVDHRTQENLTPLMLAVEAGNLPLIEVLLARGASRLQTDMFGRTAHMQALAHAHADPQYASIFLGPIYQRVCPPSLDVLTDNKLVRLDANGGEFYVLSLMLGLLPHLQSQIVAPFADAAEFAKRQQGFYSSYLQHNQELFPLNVLPENRRKRSYWNHLLARAEVDSNYQPARRLWQRNGRGIYLPAEHLKVQTIMQVSSPDDAAAQGEQWVNVQFLTDPIARAWLELHIPNSDNGASG